MPSTQSGSGTSGRSSSTVPASAAAEEDPEHHPDHDDHDAEPSRRAGTTAPTAGRSGAPARPRVATPISMSSINGLVVSDAATASPSAHTHQATGCRSRGSGRPLTVGVGQVAPTAYDGDGRPPPANSSRDHRIGTQRAGRRPRPRAAARSRSAQASGSASGGLLRRGRLLSDGRLARRFGRRCSVGVAMRSRRASVAAGGAVGSGSASRGAAGCRPSRPSARASASPSAPAVGVGVGVGLGAPAWAGGYAGRVPGRRRRSRRTRPTRPSGIFSEPRPSVE